tara:strand:+ start:93 stop:290 length:198 start_codon:yes stop_codon:yes gene_type:complete
MVSDWHYYERGDRKALVKSNEKGFFVDLYYKDKFLEKRKVYDHSESYAESLAENWVDGIISNPSG